MSRREVSLFTAWCPASLPRSASRLRNDVGCVVPAAGVDEPVSNVVVYGMMPSVSDVNCGEVHEESEESCVDAVDYGMMHPFAATCYCEAREEIEESCVDAVGYGMVFPLFSYDSYVEAHGVNAVGYGGASHGGALW